MKEYFFPFDNGGRFATLNGISISQGDQNGTKFLVIAIVDNGKREEVDVSATRAVELAEAIMRVVEHPPGAEEEALRASIREAERHIQNAHLALQEGRAVPEWNRLTSSFKAGAVVGARTVLRALNEEDTKSIRRRGHLIAAEVAERLEQEHEAYDEKTP